MVDIGFHASHEQIHPGQLLADVCAAEAAGFRAAMCSDHFAPWSTRQGHSGLALAWLGAALARTRLTFGFVNAPGQRYHPAIVAQGVATLAAMFPGRCWVAIGSGENVNEHITGERWPRKEVRDARLAECADVMARLFRGEEVSHDGLVRVDRARLWTLPDDPPDLVLPALSEQTARLHAGWADGMITVDAPRAQLERLVAAYRDAGGRGPLSVQVHLSWAPTRDEALQIAHEQWRTNVFGAPVTWDLATVEEFDAVSEHVPAEAVADAVFVSADPDEHVAHLAELAEIGFDRIYLHHVGQEQKAFIDTFGERVLPAFAGGPAG